MQKRVKIRRPVSPRGRAKPSRRQRYVDGTLLALLDLRLTWDTCGRPLRLAAYVLRLGWSDGGPAIRWPCHTVALPYGGPAIRRPCHTVALPYGGHAIRWPCLQSSLQTSWRTLRRGPANTASSPRADIWMGGKGRRTPMTFVSLTGPK